MRHSPVSCHFTQYIKDGVVLTRYTNGQLKKNNNWTPWFSFLTDCDFKRRLQLLLE